MTNTKEKLKQRVVCAAMRNKEGLIVCGARHYDTVMRALIPELGGRKAWIGAEQGFIDQFGVFLTREEAHVIATEQEQIRRRCGGDKETLFSENLY
jgi:hypothetical protein